MFENLFDCFGGVFDWLIKQGVLFEDDVVVVMCEVCVVLFEVDVLLLVVCSFVKFVIVKVIGSVVIKLIIFGQQVVKIVYDELIKVLQGEGEFDVLCIDNLFVLILMVGLQGLGKIIMIVKLVKCLKDCEKKWVLLVLLDINCLVVMEQLVIFGMQIGVDILFIVLGENVVQIVRCVK